MTKRKTPDFVQPLSRWLAGIIVFILVVLPFHALCTTWLGSNFGYIDWFRIWKELLLVPLVLGCAVILGCDRQVRQRVLGARLFWLCAAYAVWALVMGLWALQRQAVNGEALIYGLLTSTRFVIFAMACWIVALKQSFLPAQWRRILLAPALLVVSFGVLQALILPADFLRHFGYGPDTIPAIQTVDQQIEFRRIQSTLRGANPLGAYLVLIVSAFVTLVMRKREQRGFGLFLVAATLAVLFATYSRSAYLGATLSIGVLVWQLLPNRQWRRMALVASVMVAIVGSAAVFALRDNDTVQNTVFHSSEASPSAESSNAGRASALKMGLRDVVYEPLGRGTGTAGPASFRNNHPPRIAENYYLQVAQEQGVVGLGLFMVINILVGFELWRRRASGLALLLLASLAGITLINLLSHAWADDTLSLLWWGLAGLALAVPPSSDQNMNAYAILRKRPITGKKHGKAKDISSN